MLAGCNFALHASAPHKTDSALADHSAAVLVKCGALEAAVHQTRAAALGTADQRCLGLAHLHHVAFVKRRGARRVPVQTRRCR